MVKDSNNNRYGLNDELKQFVKDNKEYNFIQNQQYFDPDDPYYYNSIEMNNMMNKLNDQIEQNNNEKIENDNNGNIKSQEINKEKIVVDKDLEIKLSTILLTSNKLVVIGGQNNGSSEESQVTYKFYKVIKVKKANSTNFKYSLKFLNAHIKKSQKLLADDDVWLNAMAEGSNGTIINGLGSTYMNKDYGQIDIFFREIKNSKEKEKEKESKNLFNDSKIKK